MFVNAMKIIGHLDMDAFFASVEERDHGFLRGFPIVVGADPDEGKGRGVVSTANYKARKFGIHSAMPISKAWRLAEEARGRGEEKTVFLMPHFSRYNESSARIFAIIRRHAPQIEEASIDEAYFDISFAGSYKGAEKIARGIKDEIREKEKLTASIGIGPNKLIAKIASDRQKPDGLTVVAEDAAEEFLLPLPIRVIPGIGPKTEQLFKKLGVGFVQDLKPYTKKELQKMLGKWGASLYEKLRGKGNASIQEEPDAPKSVGEQETFRRDTLDSIFIFERLKHLSHTVFLRFQHKGFLTFGTVGVTVRFADFKTSTRAHTLTEPAKSEGVLYFEALKLCMPFFDSRENPKKKLIRLVGVRIENLK